MDQPDDFQDLVKRLEQQTPSQDMNTVFIELVEEGGFDVLNVRDQRKGTTVLHHVVMHWLSDSERKNGVKVIVRRLLEHGVDPNVQETSSSTTALHHALINLSSDNQDVALAVVTELLQHGADIHVIFKMTWVNQPCTS